MDQPVKRRPGRPPKIEGEKKSRSFTCRLRDGIVPKIEAAAAGRGHSMSEEMERRLVASFDAETLEALLRRVVREEIGSLGLTQEGDFARYARQQEELRHVRALRDIGGDALAVMVDAQH